MIMRLALARVDVVMRADAETELGILVEDIALAGIGVVMRRDEALVLARLLDEGTDLPKLSRIYRQVVFPVGAEDQTDKRRQSLKQTVNKLVELLALARDEKLVPPQLCAEVEEPLQRLALALK